MLTPLLDIQNLSVDFINGESLTKALKNVTISVSRGEILAIVGESGSGKSVTSLSILQLLASPPALYKRGKISLYITDEPVNMLKVPRKKLQSIRGNDVAMIFQEPMSSLNPVLTCGFQVMEAIRQHNAIHKIAGARNHVHPLPSPVEWRTKTACHDCHGNEL
jgi:peptide/nickel transport system ATP-binding protein